MVYKLKDLIDDTHYNMRYYRIPAEWAVKDFYNQKKECLIKKDEGGWVPSNHLNRYCGLIGDELGIELTSQDYYDKFIEGIPYRFQLKCSNPGCTHNLPFYGISRGGYGFKSDLTKLRYCSDKCQYDHEYQVKYNIVDLDLSDDIRNLLDKFLETNDEAYYYKALLKKDDNYIRVNHYLILNDYYSKIWETSFKLLNNLTDVKLKYESGWAPWEIDEFYGVKNHLTFSLLRYITTPRTLSESCANSYVQKDRPTTWGRHSVFMLNGKKIIFRSSLELAYCQSIIDLPEVSLIEYEPLIIPLSTGKYYVPDFKVTYKNGDVELIEIKPKSQLNDETVIQKKLDSEIYCKKLHWKYMILTEEDLNLYDYPNLEDPRLLEYRSRKSGDYRLDITYESIMDYIESKPKYSVSLYEIYSKFISRTGLVYRLREEAPSDEKDIRRWILKYLKDDEAVKYFEYDKIKLEYQLSGIRDFGLKTKKEILEFIETSDKFLYKGDILEFLDMGCRGYRYLSEILNLDLNEIIEENNNKFR